MARSREEFLRVDTDAPHHWRICDEPGCACEGQFRAPRSRDHLDLYYWFCLDHVRAYNAAWNYYAGMNDREIEAEIRRDTVWQRPTWPLGWKVSGRRINDPFDLTGDKSREDAPMSRRHPLSPEERAMAVFDLEGGFTLAELKRRYKVLVKAHHPDANGGDKSAEERLKTINEAYSLLKRRFIASRPAE